MRANLNPKRPKYFENIYGAEVLINNWYELRLADQIDKKAIAPAITGKSDCCGHQSTYQAAYTKAKPFKPTEEETNEAIDLKVTGYANKINGVNGHIRMFHGEQFMNNCVTTTDISYRIIPQLVRKHPKETKLGEAPHKFDNYGLYGNATETGLRAWYACEEKRQKRSDLSTMKTEFVRKPVKPLVKATKKQGTESVFPVDNTIGFCSFK